MSQSAHLFQSFFGLKFEDVPILRLIFFNNHSVSLFFEAFSSTCAFQALQLSWWKALSLLFQRKAVEKSVSGPKQKNFPARCGSPTDQHIRKTNNFPRKVSFEPEYQQLEAA